MVKGYLTALTLLAVVGLSANSYASDQEGLQVELTPYFWAAGVDGKITSGLQTAHFNASFSDIKDNINSGFMILGVLSYNRWVLYGDYDNVGLKSDRFQVSPTDSVRGSLDADVTTLAGGYRFDTFGDSNWIDVMVGSRTMALDTKISRSGTAPASNANSHDITDTVIVLRPSFKLGEKWRLNPTFDYGVTGDSDTTYMMSPQIQYDFSKSLALRFGYKKLNYQEKHGVANTASFGEIDANIEGFMLGVGWKFPMHEKPVPVAAPAPAPKPAPPVVAAKCPDGDKDGVCDAVDACPDTPAGTRVGPAGCDCDYVLRTHFAFDSAELTAEDKTALDGLVKLLMNPKLSFVAGTIIGHTDNVGTPEYNLDLSKRRADAVANYAKSKGLNLGAQFQVIGKGEADPIADNKTEDGRAQNRRVTIRRTDCGPAPGK